MGWKAVRDYFKIGGALRVHGSAESFSVSEVVGVKPLKVVPLIEVVVMDGAPGSDDVGFFITKVETPQTRQGFNQVDQLFEALHQAAYKDKVLAGLMAQGDTFTRQIELFYADQGQVCLTFCEKYADGEVTVCGQLIDETRHRPWHGDALSDARDALGKKLRLVLREVLLQQRLLGSALHSSDEFRKGFADFPEDACQRVAIACDSANKYLAAAVTLLSDAEAVLRDERFDPQVAPGKPVAAVGKKIPGTYCGPLFLGSESQKLFLLEHAEELLDPRYSRCLPCPGPAFEDLFKSVFGTGLGDKLGWPAWLVHAVGTVYDSLHTRELRWQFIREVFQQLPVTCQAENLPATALYLYAGLRRKDAEFGKPQNLAAKLVEHLRRVTNPAAANQPNNE